VSHLFVVGYEYAKKRRELAAKFKQAEQRLHKLTEVEKKLLRGYIANQTRTQNFPIENGVVRGLEAEYIIYRAGSIGQLNSWPYNIQPWAWDYLNKHKGLLS
jgi:hypothetical protein